MPWQTPFRRTTCWCDNSYQNTGYRYAVKIKIRREVYFTMQFMESRVHGKSIRRDAVAWDFYLGELIKPIGA